MNIIHHEIGRDAFYKTWHCANQSMIIYIYTDGGNIVFYDEIYPMKKGTLCMIKQGTYHYTVPSEPTTYDRSKIYLEERIVTKITNLMPDRSEFRDLFSKNSVVYAQIPDSKIAEVENIYSEGLKGEEELINSFFKLMIYLKKHTVKQISKPEDDISKAIEYINKKYYEDISPSKISDEIHISKYHFCRKFKKLMGITVMDYILKTRITAAKTMLSEDIPISMICEKCGFSSSSYFCQIFKRSTGMTASEFRKNSKKNIKDFKHTNYQLPTKS